MIRMQKISAMIPVVIGVTFPVFGQAAEQVVDVTLSDYQIDMPHTLAAGPTTFRIVNRGLGNHNLEIRGQGSRIKVSQDLPAGRTAIMHVNLKPGQYYVICPVPTHEGAGMYLKLSVGKISMEKG